MQTTLDDMRLPHRRAEMGIAAKHATERRSRGGSGLVLRSGKAWGCALVLLALVAGLVVWLVLRNPSSGPNYIVYARKVMRVTIPTRRETYASKMLRQTFPQAPAEFEGGSGQLRMADPRAEVFVVLKLEGLPASAMAGGGSFPLEPSFVVAGEQEFRIDYARQGGNVCVLAAGVPRGIFDMTLHLPGLPPMPFHAEGIFVDELHVDAL